MKSSLEHLPERKQRELARVVEIIHEEFEDALRGGEAEFKKKGRIWKIILFGSYARGTWVDEPHTSKGYRSDYDILIIVSTKKLTEPEYWYGAKDRLMRDRGIKTPVGVIVHSRREVGDALHLGQPFFSDIRRDGIVLYEFDETSLPEPRMLSNEEIAAVAKSHFIARFHLAVGFLEGAKFHLKRGDRNLAAFNLQQAIEASYNTFLLVFTNYSPASHNLNLLRSLSEQYQEKLASLWPRDRQRFVAWFNVVNEAYVKARYSPNYAITDEALHWLLERTIDLTKTIQHLCQKKVSET